MSEVDLDLELTYATKTTAQVAPIAETVCRVCGNASCFIAPHIRARHFSAGQFSDYETPSWWTGPAAMGPGYRPEVEGMERSASPLSVTFRQWNERRSQSGKTLVELYGAGDAFKVSMPSWTLRP